MRAWMLIVCIISLSGCATAQSVTVKFQPEPGVTWEIELR